MEKSYRTLFVIVLYVAFICRPLALIPPILRVWIFLILLVIQSMNTALQLSQLRKSGENIAVKVITTILNIVVLGLGMLFAFMLFFVF